MNKDIYELIEKIIDNKVKGADTYINNGSRWLIFTDEKKWIFELTKEGTLWYNFYFFENIFKIISLTVVENQHHITEWVENFIQNGVKETLNTAYMPQEMVEETIENGVKETKYCELHSLMRADHIIRDGVKETNWRKVDNFPEFEERVIENGIKETWGYEKQPQIRVNEVINKGEKH